MINKLDKIKRINKNYSGEKETKGYCFNKREGKYIARICVNGKSISLGYYKTEEEAGYAYKKALEIKNGG